MADYISCMEATGGNKEQIRDEVTTNQDTSAGGSVKGQIKSLATSGGGSIVLDRKTEESIAKRIEKKWFPGAGSDCLKAMQAPAANTSHKKLRPSVSQKLDADFEILGVYASDLDSLWVVGDAPKHFIRPQIFHNNYRELFNISFHVINRSKDTIYINELRVYSKKKALRPSKDADLSAVRNAEVLVYLADKAIPREDVDTFAQNFNLGSRQMLSIDDYVLFKPKIFDLRKLAMMRASPLVAKIEVKPTSDYPGWDPPTLSLFIPQGASISEQPRGVYSSRGYFDRGDGLIDINFKFESVGVYEIVIELLTDHGVTKSTPFLVQIERV